MKQSRFERAVLAMTVIVLATMGIAFAFRRTEPTGAWQVEVQYSDRVPVSADTSAQTYPDSLREGEIIDLNTATKSDLQRLPGIGAVRAEAILAYRQEKGRFSTPAELMKVKGIGKGIFQQVSPYITAS